MEWWLIRAVLIIFLSPCSSILRCQHYLNRRKEGVFHYDRHLRYQLNYHKAQEACVQDFGGKIATRDQLEKALKSGLEECRAGWITSAEVAYPRINRHWNCGENKTGIISYGIRQNLLEKWDVFCYKDDDDCSRYDRAFFKVSWGTTKPEFSFTSEFPTTSTLPSPTSVPKRGDLNSSLPLERSKLDVAKIKNSEDQENNFKGLFPSVNFSEHNESMNEQEVKSFNTSIELNSTSDTYKVDQKIDKTISHETNLTSSTYAPTSVYDTKSKPHLPTGDSRSHADSSAKSPLNLTISGSDNVTNSILNETGSNINFYKIMAGKEKFDVLRPGPQSAITENPSYGNKTFIPGESTTTMKNILKTSKSEIETYFREKYETKTDLYSTDFLSNSQHRDITKENTILITSSKSHTDIVQTMTDNLLHQEHEHPIATTPLADHVPTENQMHALQLTTNPTSSQLKTFSDIYPTIPLHLQYQERQDPAFVDLTYNASSERTPTSNMENKINIDGKRKVIRGTPKYTSTSTTVTKHPKNIAPTISSFFTPYDHMKVTASPTPKNNVTNLSLGSCGAWFKALTGHFHSPGFPQSYEKDMNCVWVIEVPLGYYIILDFVSLVIEEHRNCEYDYVMIYDGMESDQRVLGRFCGSQLPPQMRASSNVMTVIMRSDSSVELDGISVHFRATQTSSGISLTGGKNSIEGVVEIESQGIRGNICAKQWTNNEAQVVCRQLGFPGPALATRIIGDDNVRWAISFLSCSGRESTLENCSRKSTGVCDTKERAGVICQVYESCAHLKNAGIQESGTYNIDPDGLGQGENHFPVQCDMASDSTTGITIVGHDSEGKERVSSCKTPGCYSRVIAYKAASFAQLKTLTSISENCEQFVKLDCRHVRFLDGPWGWWVSRDGEQINSWGGASTNSGRCACGENGDCAFDITSCNCDANDDIWRMDEGAITDKSSLPIHEFRLGGTSEVPMAMAFHRIGKLRCWGTISEPPVLESCAALKEAGFTDSGRYLIDPDGIDSGVPRFEVFCDMSSQSGITVIGHNSERRMPVSPCEEAGCYKRELIYSADLLQLNALTKVSQSCEQFVRLDCRHLRFIQSGWGWWISWDGKRMDYWGGADPSTGGCACGATGTCSSPDKLCNCDSNDNIWRTDDGFLRDKTALPIQAVYFGDTNDFPLEMAYHTIGKLRCRG